MPASTIEKTDLADKCPFCGKSKEMYLMRNGDDAPPFAQNKWHLACNSCGTMGPMYRDSARAIMAWNHVSSVYWRAVYEGKYHEV